MCVSGYPIEQTNLSTLDFVSIIFKLSAIFYNPTPGKRARLNLSGLYIYFSTITNRNLFNVSIATIVPQIEFSLRESKVMFIATAVWRMVAWLDTDTTCQSCVPHATWLSLTSFSHWWLEVSSLQTLKLFVWDGRLYIYQLDGHRIAEKILKIR